MDVFKPGELLQCVGRVWTLYHWEGGYRSFRIVSILERFTYIAKGKQKDFVQFWEPYMNILKDGNVGFTWNEIVGNLGILLPYVSLIWRYNIRKWQTHTHKSSKLRLKSCCIVYYRCYRKLQDNFEYKSIPKPQHVKTLRVLEY